MWQRHTCKEERGWLGQRNTMLFFWTQALHAEKNYGSWLLSLKDGWKATSFFKYRFFRFVSGSVVAHPHRLPGSICLPTTPGTREQIWASLLLERDNVVLDAMASHHNEIHHPSPAVLHGKKTNITKSMWVPVKFPLKLEMFALCHCPSACWSGGRCWAWWMDPYSFFYLHLNTETFSFAIRKQWVKQFFDLSWAGVRLSSALHHFLVVLFPGNRASCF